MAAPAVQAPGVWDNLKIFLLDSLEAGEDLSKNSYFVKELSKLMMGITTIAVDNPSLKSLASSAVTIIDITDLPQSIAYWSKGTYKEDAWYKVVANVFLTAIRALALIKGLIIAKIIDLSEVSEWLGKIPVVGEFFQKTNLDTAIGVLYVPFSLFSLTTNVIEMQTANETISHEEASIANWQGLTNPQAAQALTAKQQKIIQNPNVPKYQKYKNLERINIATLANPQLNELRNLQIRKCESKRNLAKISKPKNMLGFASTSLKLVIALTVLVATAIFGSVLLLASVLAILATLATALTLSKIVYEGYQAKYVRQNKEQIAAFV